MRHLRYLELSGNPLAEETGYRLLVVKHLPWLEILDMHKVRCGLRCRQLLPGYFQQNASFTLTGLLS